MADQQGNYKFKPDQLKAAHKWCKENAAEALVKYGAVVISNSCATLRTLLPYFRIAYTQKAMIIIREPDTPWRRNVAECARRNKHKVQLKVIQGYADKWFPIKQAAYSYNDMWHGELTGE